MPPFGMLQPGRKFSAGSGYRYGFNGKENDKEVKGDGNQQDYGMRFYDPRLGRFLSFDPLAHSYHDLSPYHFAGCNPIRNLDLDGGEPKDYVQLWLPLAKSSTINGTSYKGNYLEDFQGTKQILDVRLIYDKVTDQKWFVHQAPNGGWYYWKMNDPGKSQTHRIVQSTSGPNGLWVPFETQNHIDGRLGGESADFIGMAFIASGAFIASIPAIIAAGSAGSAYVAASG